MSCGVLSTLISFSTSSPIQRSHPHTLRVTASATTLTLSRISGSITSVMSPAAVVSRRFICTTWRSHSLRGSHPHFLPCTRCTSAMHNNKLLYSSKAISTKGQRRTPVSFASRFTRSSTAASASSITLSTAGLEQTDSITEGDHTSPRSVPDNEAANKASFSSSHTSRVRFNSQDRAKSSGSASRQPPSDSREDGGRFIRHVKRRGNNCVDSADKPGAKEDCSELRRLLRVHNNFRRSHTFERNKSAYNSFCGKCLKTLSESQLLQRLCHGFATNESDGNEDKSRSVGEKSTQVFSPTPGGAHILLEVVAEAPDSFAVSVQLPVEALRWLGSPITLPEILCTELLHAAPTAKMMSNAGKSASETGFYSSSSIPQQRWQQHWLHENPRGFEHVFEECFGLESFRPSPITDTDGLAMTIEDPSEKKLDGKVPERTFIAPEKSEAIFDLLRTIAFFKWEKDEGVLASRQVKALNTVKHSASEHHKGSRENLGGSDFLNFHTTGMRTALAKLRALDKKVEMQAGEAAQSSAIHLADNPEERSNLGNQLLSHAQDVLDAIPKVDFLLQLASPPSSSPTSSELHVSAKGEDVKEGGRNPVAMPNEIRAYSIHVIDLLFALLFRYMLLQWPLLLDEHQRGTLFRLGTLPWFTQDITQSMAIWYTFWETFPRIGSSFWGGSSSKNTAPQQLRHRRRHLSGGVDLEFSSSPFHKTSFLTYMQFLRMVCCPHVLDWRSATLRRALGLSPSLDSATNLEDGLCLPGVNSNGKEESQVNRIPTLKGIASILYSSESKQRLTYELLYLVFSWFNTTAATPSGNKSDEKPEVDKRVAFSRHGAVALTHLTTVNTLFVYVVDMDHFISERFYENVLRRNEWVVLSLQPPEHSLSETKEKATPSVAISEVYQNLLAQSTQPYMLTRQILQAMLPSAKPWPLLPAKGMKVVWEAVLGAVASPCYHSLATDNTTDGKEMTALEKRRTAWDLAHPLLHCLRDEWLQRILWVCLLRDLKGLVSQTTTTSSSSLFEGEKVGKGETKGVPCTQPTTAAETNNYDTKQCELERLLRLGYFGGFLLLAQCSSAAAPLEAETGPSSLSSLSPEGIGKEWAQSLRKEFDAATRQLLSQMIEKSAEPTLYVRSFLSGWLIPSPDVGTVSTFFADQDATKAASYSCLHRFLSTFVFTAGLAEEVREWTGKCESLEYRKAHLVHVKDPLLCHWHAMLQEDDIGLKPFKLSMIGLYRELWDIVSARQRAQGMDKNSCSEQVTSSSETSAAGDTLAKQGQAEADSFPRFDVYELPILLRLVGTMHARLGLHSLKSSFGSFFENLTGVIVRQFQRQQSLQKQSDTENNHESGRSLPTLGAVDSGGTALSSSTNMSVSTIKSRMLIIERSIKSSVQEQLSQLPLSAVLDAWYLGLVSRSDIGSVLCGMCRNDIDSVPGENTEVVEPALDKRHTEVEWIGNVSQFKEDLRSHKLVRLVAGLLLYKEYPFASTDTLSGGLNGDMGSSHKETQGTIGSDPKRRSEVVALMRIVLQSLVELEYDYYASEVGQSSHVASLARPSTHGAAALHTAPTHASETAGGVSMIDYAHQISRVHAIAAALFLEHGPDKRMRAEVPFCWHSRDSSLQGSGMPLDKRPCHREHVLELYALLLNALCDAIPGVERGLADELLLYLVTSTYVVQLHYKNELQCLAQQRAQECGSADVTTGSDHLFAPQLSTATASFSSDKPADPCSPPLKPVLSVFSMAQRAVGQSSSACSTPFPPPELLEALSLTMEWNAYLVMQLLPHAERNLLRFKQQSNTPNLRAVCTSAITFCGLEAIGLPVVWWAQFPVEQLLQRVAQDRGVMQRHLNYFLIAATSHPKACTALISAASYLRESRDFMPLQMLVRTFKAIILNAKALDSAQTASLEETDQRNEAETPFPTSKVSVCTNYEATHYTSSPVKGISYEKFIYMSFPHLSRNFHSHPQLRSAWSALARCLLEHHALMAPVEPFLLALQAGSCVGCADTKDFEQLLAHVLFTDGVGSELPLLAMLGLAEWAVLLTACATSVWNRSGYIQVLREPLLDFVELSTQEPFFVLRDSFHQGVLRETPMQPDATTKGQQDLLEKKRQLCIELSHFLESVSTLCVEGDAFWREIRSLVCAWTKAIQNDRSNDDDFTPIGFAMSDDEVAFWMEEWYKSFNWSVRVAGHPDLVFASDQGEGLEQDWIAALGKSD